MIDLGLDVVIDTNPEPILSRFVVGRLKAYFESCGVRTGSFHAKIERMEFSEEVMGDGKIRFEGLKNRKRLFLVVPLPAIDQKTIVSCELYRDDNPDLSDIERAISIIGGRGAQFRKARLWDVSKASLDQRILIALFERNVCPDTSEAATDIISGVAGFEFHSQAYQKLKSLKEAGFIVSSGKDGRIVRYELTKEGHRLIRGG